MPVSSSSPGEQPGLYASARALWGVLLAIIHTRLDLATVELEEAGDYVVRLLLLVLGAVCVIVMTVFFLCFFLVVYFWAEAALVLAIIFVICLLASVGLVLAARHMILERPKLLGQTLAELRRDVEGLKPKPVSPAPSQPTETP